MGKIAEKLLGAAALAALAAGMANAAPVLTRPAAPDLRAFVQSEGGEAETEEEKLRKAKQAAEEEAARKAAEEGEQPAAPPEQPAAPTGQPAEQPAAPAEQPAAPVEQPPDQPGAPAEQPAEKPTEQPAAPAEQPAEQPPAPAEQTAAPAEQPAGQPVAPSEKPAEQPSAPVGQPAEQPPASSEQPAEQPTEQPAAPTQPPSGLPAEQPAEQPVAPVEQPAEQPAAPTEPTAPPAETLLEPVPDSAAGEAAPLLDSAKEDPPPPPATGPVVEAPPPEAPTAPPPADDAAARQSIAPVVVESAREEPGERLEAAPAPEPPAPERVVQVIDNRTILTINTVIVVESRDDERLAGDDEVIVERLTRGRVRETVVRPNGVQVVTVYNRHGEIIQRSRILPDGREVFLAYAPEYDTEEFVDWRDPVYDLPPLRLRIPREDYILDASDLDNEARYYRFLDEPPVERVERVYSLQDVKRSARVRDKARRIEMGNIGFAFGSADIAEDQIDKLDALAAAMLRLIEENPAEMFLIEGHTDAVGSDVANLALSDRRAESVARALADVFGVPPENLTTQGFGERYLKVRTGEREPLNRRVVFRRITPLVSPNLADAN